MQPSIASHGLPLWRRPVSAALFPSALALAVACGGAGPKPCPPLDSTAAWARVNRAWSRDTGSWSNDSLRQVLLRLVERDQRARDSFATRLQDSTYVRQLGQLDSSLAAELTPILARFGLPSRALVGTAGSDAAMLIIQHNGQLQASALLMAQKLPEGQVSPQALAMLEDRVRVHDGRPQRYGTQFNIGPDGQFRFAATESLAGLEARRAGAGLPPFEQYVCMMEESGMRINRSTLPH